jgi:hypothetical protein
MRHFIDYRVKSPTEGYLPSTFLIVFAIPLFVSFSFSSATKIRIPEGSHAGQEGWVHERMLQ